MLGKFWHATAERKEVEAKTRFKFALALPRHLKAEGTAEAREAVRRGADYVVVGRPILRDPDPVAAARRLGASLESAR